MRLIKGLVAFVLVFALMAGTAAMISAAVSDSADAADRLESETVFPDESLESPSVRTHGYADLAEVGESFVPRLTAPAKTNPHFYSDYNIFYKYGYGMPNCTCYAWGRAYELLHQAPNLCVYSAYLWYDYNKDNGIYAYGQTPKLGAIACWVYRGENAGHVAVVEQITGDTITFSNSAWGGTEFYTNTAPVSDPSNGRATWIFQGYIYIGEYETASTDLPAEDKSSGDVYRIISDDGVNLRAGAGTAYGVVSGIGYGQDAVVTQTKKANGFTWGYTTYNGKSGWFVLEFAELKFKRDGSTQTATPAATEASSGGSKTSSPTKTSTNPTRAYMMGDLDSDGSVSVMDATRIQMVLAKYMTPTEYMITVGDYDGDNWFSVMDANRIQRDLVFGKGK